MFQKAAKPARVCLAKLEFEFFLCQTPVELSPIDGECSRVSKTFQPLVSIDFLSSLPPGEGESLAVAVSIINSVPGFHSDKSFHPLRSSTFF